jgi:hypothetical protein
MRKGLDVGSAYDEDAAEGDVEVDDDGLLMEDVEEDFNGLLLLDESDGNSRRFAFPLRYLIL